MNTLNTFNTANTITLPTESSSNEDNKFFRVKSINELLLSNASLSKEKFKVKEKEVVKEEKNHIQENKKRTNNFNKKNRLNPNSLFSSFLGNQTKKEKVESSNYFELANSSINTKKYFLT